MIYKAEIESTIGNLNFKIKRLKSPSLHVNYVYAPYVTMEMKLSVEV